MFVSQSNAELPSAATIRRHREASAEVESINAKRARADSAEVVRKSAVALKLAYFRYVKLVPGAHVDEFKSMHTELNASAFACVSAELQHLLAPHIPQEVFSETLSLIKKNYDIYEGLRTEKNELSFLHTEIPIPTHHSRPLKGTTGSAQDFEIDKQLLLLLEHNEVAREQVKETLVTWRTKGPATKDNPSKVFFDITDGLCFEKHPIFGLKGRVPENQAIEEAPTAPLRWCLLLYADAFTVCAAVSVDISMT